ncbi:MAG: hypothetical protein ACRDHZ_24970 [Ktedonobacteraceae bacterium]
MKKPKKYPIEKHYRVRWEIDIDAASSEEAARQALDIQRDPESTATLFDVFEHAQDGSGVWSRSIDAASKARRKK